MSQIPVGYPIPVVAQLGDGDTNKYVRGWVENADGEQLSGSPVNLTHIANGLYQNTSLAMPTTGFVVVQVQAFDDPSHTVPSETYIDAKVYTGVVGVGQKIPLVVQLGDGETDKFVRVYVTNALGVSIGTVDLTPSDRGLYRDDSLTMPSTPFVVVQARVFENSGYTVPSDLNIESQVYSGVPASTSVTAFKAFFYRDFPYGDTPDKIMDSDIERALLEAGASLNEALFCDADVLAVAKLYLSAHYLVMNIRASSGGLTGGGFTWLANSKSVGSVSESFAIPEYISGNPQLALLSSTAYGTKYLQMILPLLTGQMFSVWGGTNA